MAHSSVSYIERRPAGHLPYLIETRILQVCSCISCRCAFPEECDKQACKCCLEETSQ